MLAGQDIGVYELLLISLLGMTVAMTALILLMSFIMIFSKLLAAKGDEGSYKTAEPPSVQAAEGHVPEDEIAAIIAAVSAESGLRPNQFSINSITSQK